MVCLVSFEIGRFRLPAEPNPCFPALNMGRAATRGNDTGVFAGA
jgi:hypothetical protein